MSKEEINNLAAQMVANNMVTSVEQEPIEQAEEASIEEPQNEEDQSSQEVEPSDEFIEFVADGETRKATLEELKKLAAGGVNYTRKMQEIPERVKAEAERIIQDKAKQIEEERKRLISSIEFSESLYNQSFITPGQLDQLLQEGDTETYLRLTRQEENRKEILNNLKAERQKVLDTKTREEQEQLQKSANYHITNLLETMPELKTSESQSKLESFLKSMNLNDDLMLKFIANGGLAIAEKARRYDELSSKKTQPVKVEPPKVIKKVGATVNKQTYTQKGLEDSTKKLQETGRLRDAAALYLQMKGTKK